METLLALLGKVPLRWWLYAAGAAFIGFILLREHHAVNALKAERAEKAAVVAKLNQANATIETMKEDVALNRETSHELAGRLAAAAADRDKHPFELRCFRASAAAMPAESGATAGGDDAAGGRVDGSAALPTFDAAPGLSEFQQRCARNAARQLTLQEWELARKH